MIEFMRSNLIVKKNFLALCNSNLTKILSYFESCYKKKVIMNYSHVNMKKNLINRHQKMTKQGLTRSFCLILKAYEDL